MNHIVLSQNKNIGDVVFTFATAALIKHHWPACKVSLLCLPYTHPVVKQCPAVNAVIDAAELTQLPQAEAVAALKRCHADALIHLASSRHIATLGHLAGIPLRIGSGQKWYHWRYANRRLNQGRRHSSLHELELNARMLRPLGIDTRDLSRDTLIALTRLTPPREISLPQPLAQRLSQCKKPMVILHPGSHGHGREWPQTHYRDLANALYPDHQVVITGTDNEAQRFQPLLQATPHAINTMGQLSLSQLLVLINQAQALVASGTGPVHLAAAMGRPTIGLFPPRSGIGPRRWHPPGKAAICLVHQRWLPCLTCRDNAHCHCMAQITVNTVRQRLLEMGVT